jgi:hypothetical protein
MSEGLVEEEPQLTQANEDNQYLMTEALTQEVSGSNMMNSEE